MTTTAPKKEQGLSADLAERLNALAELPQIRSMVETMEGLNARAGQLPTSYFGEPPVLFNKRRPVQAPAVARPKREPEPTVEQLAPLADFEMSKPWRPADVRRFGQVYALAKRSMKKPAALAALAAAGWAPSGPTLAKRTTQANKLSQSRVARQAA